MEQGLDLRRGGNTYGDEQEAGQHHAPRADTQHDPPGEGARQAIEEDVDGDGERNRPYRSGKTQTFGWLMGQVMKRTAGRADPATVREALTHALE